MNYLSAMREIRNTPALAPHYKDVRMFLEYIRTTKRCRFNIYGEKYIEDEDGPDLFDIFRTVEYIHRWTTTYKKAILAKFYQLETWHNTEQTPVTMLTLTTYQEGQYSRSVKGKDLTIPESFELLKHSWDCLRDAIRHYIPKPSYVWIMEPHKTGYPHLHIVLFADVDDKTQRAIKNLWTKKYKAGSFEHGADFTVSPLGQNIQSIRNYLMKYLCKEFTPINSEQCDEPDWTAGELVFYALVKKYRWRLFGSSRDICKIMARRKTDDDNIEWYATELIDCHGNNHPTWIKEGYEIPKIIEAPDIMEF